MKLAEIWQNYETYTKAASEGARSLSFGGIAVVWLFKAEQHGAIHLDRLVLSAGLCFVAALALDILHYICGVIVFQIFGNIRERKTSSAQNADNPRFLNWPLDLLFWAKLLAVVAGYVCLLVYLSGKLT